MTLQVTPHDWHVTGENDLTDQCVLPFPAATETDDLELPSASAPRSLRRDGATEGTGTQDAHGHLGCVSLERPWHCVQAKPGRESLARDNIKELGIEAYCPMQVTRPVLRGRATAERLRPRFSGYLFAAFCEHDPWQHINSTLDGVHRLLYTAPDRPAVISAKWIEDLMRLGRASDGAIDDARPALHLALGDRVLITSGPFESFEATVQRVCNKRVCVAYEIFGRITVGWIDCTKLLLLDRTPAA